MSLDRAQAPTVYVASTCTNALDGFRPFRPIPPGGTTQSPRSAGIRRSAELLAAPYRGGRGRGVRARLLIRRPAGPAIGVDEWARIWVRANEAEPKPLVERLSPDTIVRRWRGPSPRSDIDFYAVQGAGHTWPGSRLALPRALFGRTSDTFDATRVIWQFLAAHARDT